MAVKSIILVDVSIFIFIKFIFGYCRCHIPKFNPEKKKEN